MFNTITSTKDNYNVVVSGNIHSYNTIKNSKIYSASVKSSDICDCEVFDGCSLNFVYARQSKIYNDSQIGVFSVLRPNTIICKNAKVGNFVETKNAVIGAKSKVPHLSYVGDAEIGKAVNIGCGTVFCNYNGKIKQKSIIKDNVFVGSNSNIVAPVIVESGSYIAAGSTITEDVPPGSLAIARSRQINKLNYIKD